MDEQKDMQESSMQNGDYYCVSYDTPVEPIFFLTAESIDFKNSNHDVIYGYDLMDDHIDETDGKEYRTFALMMVGTPNNINEIQLRTPIHDDADEAI